MINFAGIPPQTSLSGTCLVTILPAAITEFLPTEQFGIKIVLVPIKQFSNSSILPTLSISPRLSPSNLATLNTLTS